jgi:hypothetical protein
MRHSWNIELVAKRVVNVQLFMHDERITEVNRFAAFGDVSDLSEFTNVIWKVVSCSRSCMLRENHEKRTWAKRSGTVRRFWLDGRKGRQWELPMKCNQMRQVNISRNGRGTRTKGEVLGCNCYPIYWTGSHCKCSSVTEDTKNGVRSLHETHLSVLVSFENSKYFFRWR